MQASVTRPARRREHRRLPFEPEDAAPRVRRAVQHARVVHEIARGKIVGAVDDHVEGFDQRLRVRHRERRVERLDSDLGIESPDAVARRVELRAADVGRAMDDLPLQVAEVDDVEVDETERAHACRGEIERGRRAEPAGADAQYAGRLQPPLSFFADFGQQQMTAVALPLGLRKAHLTIIATDYTEYTEHVPNATLPASSYRLRFTAAGLQLFSFRISVFRNPWTPVYSVAEIVAFADPLAYTSWQCQSRWFCWRCSLLPPPQQWRGPWRPSDGQSRRSTHSTRRRPR